MTATATRTAFDRVQRELGGELVSLMGWTWPLTFGDPIGEHHAVRTDVAVWDGSPHQKWEVIGPDATRLVDRAFTVDLSRMQVGDVRYGPFCNDDGTMVGDGTVFKLGHEQYWAITAAETDGEHLVEVGSDLDARVDARTHDLPQLGLNGPRARDVLASLCDRDPHTLEYFRFWPEKVAVGGVPCWVSRTGYSGELGYELFTAPANAEELWAVLIAAGARPYGLAAVNTTRIEAGLIAIGADFTPHRTSPYDVSLDRFVDLRKSEFIGRDALLAISAAPPLALVTLRIDGEPPEVGASVSLGTRRVGSVTSTCASPTLDATIGLAVIERASAREGTELHIEGDRQQRCVIAPTPIHDTKKQRPRA